MDRVVPIAMEPLAREPDGGHLRVGDLDALRVRVRVQLAPHGQPGGRLVAPIRLTITAWLTSGRPRQFWLM